MKPTQNVGRPAGARVLLACALLGASPAVTRAVTPPPAPVSLTVQVTLALSALHPAVTQGGLDCGALARPAAWVEARRPALLDYDSVDALVLRPAHYLGQESLASFAVAARGYTGTATVHFTLAPDGLIDPATRQPWAPSPTVLVACWLTLNGRPAQWDRGAGAVVVSATNFEGVTPNPLLVATVGASGAGPLAASASLSARGQYFVPAPVVLAATAPATTPARAPIAPAAGGSAATAASHPVPAPLTLSGALAAAAGPRTPAPITLGGALAAAAGPRIPAPITLGGALTAAGGPRIPAPLVLAGSLSASGGTAGPAVPASTPAAALPPQ